jgi:hypothetical protein
MKKIIPFILLLAACTKTTLEQPTVQVDSAAHVNGKESFPLQFLTYDSCNNEPVVFEAVLEYKYNYVNQGNDLYAIACYQWRGGRGVGQTTGAEYKLIGRTFSIEQVLEDPQVYNVRVKSKLTMQTKGANFVVEGTYRLYMEDGVIKTFVETQNSYCK